MNNATVLELQMRVAISPRDRELITCGQELRQEIANRITAYTNQSIFEILSFPDIHPVATNKTGKEIILESLFLNDNRQLCKVHVIAWKRAFVIQHGIALVQQEIRDHELDHFLNGYDK
jgi:hypothetical protein